VESDRSGVRFRPPASIYKGGFCALPLAKNLDSRGVPRDDGPKGLIQARYKYTDAESFRGCSESCPPPRALRLLVRWRNRLYKAI